MVYVLHTAYGHACAFLYIPGAPSDTHAHVNVNMYTGICIPYACMHTVCIPIYPRSSICMRMRMHMYTSICTCVCRVTSGVNTCISIPVCRSVTSGGERMFVHIYTVPVYVHVCRVTSGGEKRHPSGEFVSVMEPSIVLTPSTAT